MIPFFGSLNKGLSINLKSFLLEQSPASADQAPQRESSRTQSSLWNRGKKQSGSVHKTYPTPKADKITAHTEKRKQIPKSCSCLQLMAAGKRRAIFSNGVTVYISHTPEQAPCSRIVGQCKMNSMFCFVPGGAFHLLVLVFGISGQS